jgi:hypothetical protein
MVAGEVVEACNHYLVTPQMFVDAVTVVPDLRAFLEQAGAQANSLYGTLARSTTWPGFTATDRADLRAALAKLSSAARDFQARMAARGRKGRRPDYHRHALENAVATTLQRRGIRPTTAKDGTFALVLEQVHHAVGISERDVTKSVRRAHSALMRAQKAG